uniref:Uncharacterized protein AlNc14C70G4848 n=1 Tax=Albugo laibachii Nc14 TaxID=890382 RepID=F0WDY0_9STRA|nr:conserved hypothetical protein [Albugo laibachii Nc14]|eukprot:CCA19408.1 conserved hypothetical protein [Albugo laibachii Nc14]
MKEAYVTRQEDLLRQNEAVDKKLTELENRRRQHLATLPAEASSTFFDASGEEDSNQDQHHDESAESYDGSDMSRISLKDHSESLSERKPHLKRISRRMESRSAKEEKNADQKRSINNNVDVEPGAPAQGLGFEATIRYQKARLRVLKDDLDATNTKVEELRTSNDTLKSQIEELSNENAVTNKKHHHTLQLLTKQKELTSALEKQQSILEAQLVAGRARIEELEHAQKQFALQTRSKEVRLNRALEELEKVKSQLQQERQTPSEATVPKSEYDKLVKECRNLDKQKSELLVVFKKQMKLIDLLKRQRIHMEAAKMLSFSEEEFSRILESEM